MSIKLKKELCAETELMRDVYAKVLVKLAADNKNIAALDSDLMCSSGMKPFMEAYPDRFINCGIAEANMIGVASGMSAMGYIPFAHSFATFATRRCCDQIFMSAAYSRLNVRIIGTDPGVCAGYNGGTHMPFEDMAVLRGIAEITLIEPTDSVMLENLLPRLVEAYGVFYVRLFRKQAVGIYEPGSKFEIGKGVTLRDGRDVTLFASGIMVAESLKAAEMLEKNGISARVVNLFTWKPADMELIVKCAEETGAAVTCENHNVVGGLGSAVAEILVKNRPIPVEMVGVQDEFGEVGPEEYLRGRFNLNAVDIAAAAMRVVGRKD
jgi:transketolase